MDLEVYKQIREKLQEGKTEEFLTLIEKNKCMEYVNPAFGSWLHEAVRYSNIDAVNYLIERGIDVNRKGGVLGTNALHKATMYGDLEIIKILLTSNSLIDTSDVTKDPVFSSIYYKQLDTLKLLIEKGVEYKNKHKINGKDKVSILDYAEMYGNDEIIEYVSTLKLDNTEEKVKEREEKRELTLCIVGKWKNEDELIKAIKKTGFKNGIEVDINDEISAIELKGNVYSTDYCDKEPYYEEKFEYGLRTGKRGLKEIKKYETVFYIYGEYEGNEELKELIHFTQGLMKQGTLGVALDTVGVAYTRKEWLKIDTKNIVDIKEHITICIYTDEYVTTYGMKAFGHTDVKFQIGGGLVREQCVSNAQAITEAVLIEGIFLEDGQRTTGDKEYIVKKTEDYRHGKLDSYHNPFGLIELIAE